MILAQELHKSFGRVRAVRGVSFQIPAGQIVGLLGPNGAGKSTTIRMLCGLIPPDDGAVLIGGSDSLEESIAVRRRIGYLPENNPLYPEMRVRDYLLHRARLQRVPRAQRARAVDGAAKTCWLTDVSRRRIGALSKGYRQRVGLAAALVHAPPVLLLDEPTSGLDPSQILETRALLRSLAGRHTVILSSHILPEVEKTCERLIVIARGRVLADGSPRELSERHGGGAVVAEFTGADAGEVVAALLGAPGIGAAAESSDPGATTWRRVRVTPAQRGADVREAVGAAVASKGGRLRELRRDDDAMESLFASLIEGAAEGEAS